MADQCYAQLLECSEKQSTIKYSAALAFCKPGIKVSGLEKTRELPFSGPMGEEKKKRFQKDYDTCPVRVDKSTKSVHS